MVEDDDDEIVEDSTIDPGEQWVGIVEDEGHLVPIENEDEDPRDPSRLVDRVMEREELRQRRLTMDDQAWQEVMETEQLLWIDLVPGYIPAPAYDSDWEDQIVFANRAVFYVH